MNQGWSGNECERAHTLTTTTTGSKNSQNEANNQTEYHSHNALGPPKVPSLLALGLMRGQVQDTQPAINKLNSKEVESLNLIENAQSVPFKAPCCCFENFRILRLTTFNALLQYVNWLVLEICSVN